MSLSKSSLTFACGISAILLSGCATSTLIKKDSKKTYSHSVNVTLIEDQVVAFGQPAKPLPNLPVGSLVIAGQQKSLYAHQQSDFNRRPSRSIWTARKTFT